MGSILTTCLIPLGYHVLYYTGKLGFMMINLNPKSALTFYTPTNLTLPNSNLKVLKSLKVVINFNLSTLNFPRPLDIFMVWCKQKIVPMLQFSIQTKIEWFRDTIEKGLEVKMCDKKWFKDLKLSLCCEIVAHRNDAIIFWNKFVTFICLSKHNNFNKTIKKYFFVLKNFNEILHISVYIYIYEEQPSIKCSFNLFLNLEVYMKIYIQTFNHTVCYNNDDDYDVCKLFFH